MTVLITDSPFEPYTELKNFVESSISLNPEVGGCSTFVGSMRDFNLGQKVDSMFLEHYSPMTEDISNQVIFYAIKRWKLLDAFLIHRVGRVFPCDPIVLVATWSSHRSDCFESCRHIVEQLKTEIPFWKKEYVGEASRWVSVNTPREAK